MTAEAAKRAIVRKLVEQFKDEGWDKAWQEDITPWDAGGVQPPLRDLLFSNQLDWPRKGRALVPGCGRGYDPIFIATTLGLDTLAVDISATAVHAANRLLELSPDVLSAKISFQEADFFTFSVQKDELFDLVYDYTFFVAIPPSKRVHWGQQMNAMVKPGGFLITLIYPLDSPKEYGPPFYVQLEHYTESLGSQNWEKMIDKVPENSSETHIGREQLVVWRKL
ncbi:hypothetical protein PILCRDRAFT_94640 [Piloderma croceum F 1598]|uniref:Methyltransferase domain-containing protein n=1 Tax=Piloderma croceum (strain F 1598) TaxID=765440 RepID=A0A0C3GHA9_PILCF|nr:hypothetical protein PILCRDRAFT_94640 [Piloderma croceum F 1598]